MSTTIYVTVFACKLNWLLDISFTQISALALPERNTLPPLTNIDKSPVFSTSQKLSVFVLNELSNWLKSLNQTLAQL